MANCIRCGKSIGVFSSNSIYLCEVEQSLCKECYDTHFAAYEAADEEGKIALTEGLARSPDLKKRELVLQRLPEFREKLLQKKEARLQQEEAARQRQADVAKFASCCGQPMAELGVSTFQLGEATFLLGDADHWMSGSKKMAMFRCNTCGQLKFFDPDFVK